MLKNVLIYQYTKLSSDQSSCIQLNSHQIHNYSEYFLTVG